MSERALAFPCGGDELLGILHMPEGPAKKLAVLIIVGGPQYRVGSHRQFVITARYLAAAGYPALRFDYRGMGDSSGAPRGFESVDEDIRAAIDVVSNQVPGVGGVVLYGLCDAASAALMYCVGDPRVAGLILINPWARTSHTQSKTLVKHYYGRRFLQKSFWTKLFSGELAIFGSIWGFVVELKKAWLVNSDAGVKPKAHFIDRMRQGLAGFSGPVLSLISDRDLTAREFLDLYHGSEEWRAIASKAEIQLVHLAGADHTFSSRAALDKANELTLAWLTTMAGRC